VPTTILDTIAVMHRRAITAQPGHDPVDAETIVVDPEQELALGSTVRNLDDLERRHELASSLDAALLAYLQEDRAPRPAPVKRPAPAPARLVVRTDDRSGPRRR
jgi:hypothetical protein